MMRHQSFEDMLARELSAERLALLALYQELDQLRYVEAPALRKRYMDSIGVAEEEILQLELEVSLLRKKAELIQRALNRQEEIDLEQIDRQVEEEKEEKISELEREDLTLEELPQLTEQESGELQEIFRKITAAAHPAMHPELTDLQKDLYERAVDALKMQDLPSMKLIGSMLFPPPEEVRYVQQAAVPETEKDSRDAFERYARALSIDYTLVRPLFSCFVPREDDRILLNSLETYREQRRELEEEIRAVRGAFPFTALDTLNSRSRTEDYLLDLKLRKRQAEEEKEELERKIGKLTEVM